MMRADERDAERLRPMERHWQEALVALEEAETCGAARDRTA
jgi:hypothetical protein